MKPSKRLKKELGSLYKDVRPMRSISAKDWDGLPESTQACIVNCVANGHRVGIVCNGVIYAYPDSFC